MGKKGMYVWQTLKGEREKVGMNSREKKKEGIGGFSSPSGKDCEMWVKSTAHVQRSIS